MLDDLNAVLGKKFGPAKYAVAWWNPTIYLDYDLIDGKGVSREEVEKAAASYLATYPGIHSVYTRSQINSGAMPLNRFAVLAARSWHTQLSGDLFLVQKTGWYLYGEPEDDCTTHGSPWTYDTHVPLVFMGKNWIKVGEYGQTAEIVDIAPTLSVILNIGFPSGSEGRVLHEILQQER